MYKLYDWNQTGRTSVRAALAELEISFELVEIDFRSGAQFSDEYMRINPRQQVPSLEFPDGSILTEITAILMHLADTHPEVVKELSDLWMDWAIEVKAIEPDAIP